MLFYLYSLLNLNIGKTNKRECPGRVYYCQSIACENKVHQEKVGMNSVGEAAGDALLSLTHTPKIEILVRVE
jgi:hypothetical protein